jgi:Kelch motif
MLGFRAPALALVAAALPAQNVFHGNGIPSAYVENTPGVLGQQLRVGFGSPTAVLPLAILGLSDGIGPVFIPHPLLGNIGLDLFSPAYQALTFGLDPAGDGSAVLLLPPGYPLPGDPPLFAHAATFEASGLSISKTVRIEWANPNGWEQTAQLGTARQLHTATPLGTGPRDNTTEVLICGGAVGSFIIPVPMASAELYAPLTRTVSPLPNMALPRAGHRAVRLVDGRVLITGGVTSGGVVTASCEFFDPTTMTFSPAPSMSTPRSAHAITVLGDGRVLVSGGVADWQNAAVNFIAALNTVQNTAELFDLATNSWTPLPNMASPRLGHSQTLLQDGRVLITSGINGGYAGQFGGGQVPTYTTSCEVFDPATLTFAPTAPLTHNEVLPPFGQIIVRNGRAFHGASLLPNGDVLITGGMLAQPASLASNDETILVPFCDLWQAGTWAQAPSLPTTMAFHGQEPFGNGALVCGGFSGGLASLSTTATTAFHDGAVVTPLASIGQDGASGTAQPRGAHTFTPLYDGTFLVYGGGVWPNTIGDGWVYTPQ